MTRLEIESAFGVNIPVVPPEEGRVYEPHFREDWDYVVDFLIEHPNIYEGIDDFDLLLPAFLWVESWYAARFTASICVQILLAIETNTIEYFHYFFNDLRESLTIERTDFDTLAYLGLPQNQFDVFSSCVADLARECHSLTDARWGNKNYPLKKFLSDVDQTLLLLNDMRAAAMRQPNS
ncbi:MAG: hypothetical protein J0L72_10545 [Armatimonadetes bacterium]|nr:hypothetical protein [Armatimonadota bacterium]